MHVNRLDLAKGVGSGRSGARHQTGIGSFDAEYDPTEIYSDLNASDSKTDHENAQVKTELEPELPYKPSNGVARKRLRKSVQAVRWK